MPQPDAPPAGATIALFSFGTLRLPDVQRANFGRLLDGRDDALPGFALSMIAIADPSVVAASGLAEHPIARRTGDLRDEVAGSVFWITPAELDAADSYEVDDYRRIAVRLRSGVEAFVYVDARQAG